MIEKKINRTMLRLVQDDITTMEVDAIVNAANNTLLGGGGVDGCIHRKAGARLLLACEDLGGCETGQAKVTPGFNLPAQFVIHTAGPIYKKEENSASLLANCISHSLKLAEANNCRTIALPAISTGVYGYPKQEAATIMLQATIDYLNKPICLIKECTFCLFSEGDLHVFNDALNKLSP